LGAKKGAENPWAGEEDMFLVHPQNNLNGLILNWCIGGCWFPPAREMGILDGRYHPNPYNASECLKVRGRRHCRLCWNHTMVAQNGLEHYLVCCLPFVALIDLLVEALPSTAIPMSFADHEIASFACCCPSRDLYPQPLKSWLPFQRALKHSNYLGRN